jgi:alpha-ketoglutarate-dependent 2,4-dichlorophenoxyacetate dioxygenase
VSLSIRQIHPIFVGEVEGIDLRDPLSLENIAAIEDGMNRYAVLIFRDQPVTDEQQIMFTRNFGRIERAVGNNITKVENRRLSDEMADVSNLEHHDRIFAQDDRRRLFELANRLWHSDSSFRVVPAKFSLLSAHAVPAKGGNTEFADMRAAYDALDETTCDEIADLVCEHSLMYSRGLLGFSDFTPEEKAMFAPVRQRLVRTHPDTGRKSLYLSAHAGAIVGWPMPEARAYLYDLTEHATRPAFVHVHKWRVHDFVIWDNRQTMHRVRRFADTKEIRDMRRTTVAGNAPTVAQVT